MRFISLFLLFELIIVYSLAEFTLLPSLKTFSEYESNDHELLLNAKNLSPEISSENELSSPDMPDIEPEVLTQMQDKILKYMGLLKNDLKNKSKTEETLGDNHFENISNNGSFPFSFPPRFMEVSPSNNQQLEHLANSYEIAQFSDVWASSEYTSQSYSSQHSYPAINAVLGFSYWCSAGHHSSDQIVTWEGTFQHPRRLSHLWIRWAYSPGKYRVLISLDNDTWQEQISWQTGYKGVLWQWLAKLFWWWKWFYKSYAEYVPFSQPVWAKRLRIQMKDPVFKYFGIYRVEPWTKKWLVMLKSAATPGTGDWCLITASNQKGLENQEVQLMDCSEAISLGDGRELWSLKSNFQVMSYSTSKCIEVADGETSDGAIIQANDCWISESSGDGRDKWVTSHDGLVRLYKDQSMCLTVLSTFEYENVCLKANVAASSTMNDGQHEAHMTVDGYRDNFWASNPGDQQATLTIFFEGAKSLKELKISWKYPAEEFEILGLLPQNIWESLGIFKNDGKSVNLNKINLLSRGFLGLKIVMLKTNERFKGEIVYGIGDINCISATKAVRLKECKELNEIKTNKFTIEDVGFVDLTAGPHLFSEKSSLIEKTNKLLSLVQILIRAPAKIYKLLEKGKKIHAVIQDLEGKLKALDTKLTIFRSFLDSEEQYMLSSLGSTSLNPVEDCSYIRRAFPHKKNGFYWIQPECSPTPLRVFCAFDHDYGKGYAFVNTLEISSIKGKLSTHYDVQMICGNIGFLPIEIKYPNEIETVVNYLQNIGLDLEANEVIPLAYDWGCFKGSCSGTYRSFSSEKSRDISAEVIGKLDQTNVLNMAFNVKGYIKDTIAIGKELNAGFLLVKLENFKIKGVLCETMSENPIELGFIKADCFTAVRGNPDFSGIQNTKIKVICPPNCKKYSISKVWGTELYKDDSSICRSAIHQGLIDDSLGGKIELELLGGRDDYEGTYANEIQSENYEMSWDRSFKVKKFDRVCPLDRYKKRVSVAPISFIEEKNNVELVTNNTGIKKELLQHLKETHKEKPQEIMVLENTKPTTEKAMEIIERIYNIETLQLKKNLKLAKDSEVLVDELMKLMSPLITDEYNNEFLANKISVLDAHYVGSLKLINYLTKLTQLKLKRLEQENNQLSISRHLASKYNKYSEDYSFNFNEVYDIFDHPQAMKGPSKWSFSRTTLLGHEKSLSQTSNINCDFCAASLLILKYKEYFDAMIECSILLRDSGIVGIVFRFKDPFNYYIFEMKQQGHGFKRIRQVIKGQSKILSEIQDGGYLQNIWYKIVVIFRQDFFEVHMCQENQNLPVDSMPLVIKAEAQELKKGKVGFLSNGQQGLYIDDFLIKPLDCIKEQDLADIRYLPPECSRFKENYYGQMELRWKVYNPDYFFDGPALWEFESNYMSKEKVIYQRTKVYSSSPEKTPTLAVLDFDKTCRNGVISFDFLAEGQGVVGLAFKLRSLSYLFLLEIGGEEEKFVQLRKRIDGKYSVLAKNFSVGYQMKQWHKVTIVMMGSLYKIYFSNSGEAPVQVFETIENSDILEGTIALSTFRTEAAFDNIKMSPLTDWLQGNNDELMSQVQDGGLYEDDEYENDKKKEAINLDIPHNNNKIQWIPCINTRTPEARKKYCEIGFEKEKNEILGCYEKFCDKCCEHEVDWIHPLHRYHCKQECENSAIASDENASWKQCLSTPRPQKSVYEYCEKVFSTKKEQKHCKLDACNLCCVLSQEFDRLEVSEEVLNKCQIACLETFYNEKQIYIPA